MRVSLPSFFAILTFAIFTVPVIGAMFIFPEVPLPHGFVRQPSVSHAAVLLAILLFAIYTSAVLLVKPTGILRPTVIFSASIRWVFIGIYMTISLVSIAIISVGLDFFARLIEDPFLAVLSFGVLIVEEKLLGYFFLGISALVAYGILDARDSVFLKWTVTGWAIFVCIFYLLVGRREIALMFLLMLAFKPQTDIPVMSKKVAISLFTAAALLLSYTSLRSTDQDSGISFKSIIEEFSSVPISAYVLERGGINDEAPFLMGTTPLRFFDNVTKTISEGFFIKESNSSGVVPVLGIAGAGYEFGFILPILILAAVALLAKTSWRYYLVGYGDHWRIYSIFMSFKVFNILRNGEFALVLMDIVMFSVLMLPMLVSKNRSFNNI